jgi:hypothetical protein
MRRIAFVVGLFVLLVAGAPDARAGGGPETTVVVVNADSPVSRQVANAYAKLRAIPASHLIEIGGVPSLGVVDLETFRKRLWAPVKTALEERGLLESTDLVAWSADFPFAVDVAAAATESKAQAYQGVPWRASLTGLTYFWRRVEAGDLKSCCDLSANRYFRRDRTAGSGSGMALDEEEKKALVEAETALKKKEYAAARDAYVRLLASAAGLSTAWYNLACCHALLGEADAALTALTGAVDHGWSNAMLTMSDPDLEALRTRPEFRALIERMRSAKVTVPPSRAFRGDTVWDAAGEPDENTGADPLNRYVLSVMLGYTGPWGNSAPEVLACLERATAADGTAPVGTVYLLANDDVRAGTRAPFFDGTVAALTGMGRGVAILTKGQAGEDGILPRNHDDVIGAVIGTAGFTWKDSGSRLLPGSIAEHLTSFGADFSHAGQTKISELLKNGAAGSSGTVAEPLALWQKFPVPALHVHYAGGCSLAEAFYQSLAGPWQTLVVGDPLARPFAAFAKVADVTAGAPEAQPATGTVTVRATVESARGSAPRILELWVDGRRRAAGPAAEPLAWDTTQEDDGVHEVRVVAVEASAVATRSFAASQRTVSNRGRSATVAGPKGAVEWGEAAIFTGKAAGAKEVDLLHGARVLATVPVKNGAWRAQVDAAALGIGTTPVVARARFDDGPAARSAPLEVDVAPPPEAKPGKAAKPPKRPKPGKEAPPAVGGTPGLALTVVDAQGRERDGELTELTDEALTKALAALGVTKVRRIEIAGEIEVAEDGLYQLVVGTAGRVDVESGGRTALPETDTTGANLLFPLVSWKAGWNPIRLTLVPGEAPPRLTVLLAGAQVAAPPAAKSLRHDT